MVTGVVVLLQPVEVLVYLKVVVPAETGVIIPALFTVAIAVLLLIHVPPVVGDNVPVEPMHIFAGAVTTGSAFTVAVNVLLVATVLQGPERNST